MNVDIIPDAESQIGRWNYKRCEHQIHQEPVTGRTQRNCKHGAVVRLDGKPLCKLHAGFELLEWAVKAGSVYTEEEAT